MKKKIFSKIFLFFISIFKIHLLNASNIEIKPLVIWHGMGDCMYSIYHFTKF
jgi:hypothetical protein